MMKKKSPKYHLLKINLKNNIYNFIGFCFFITLTLIKNEGLALLSIIFLVTFLMLIYKSQLSKKIYSLIILSLSFLPIFLWKYYCFLNGIGMIKNQFANDEILLSLGDKSSMKFKQKSLPFIIKK